MGCVNSSIISVDLSSVIMYWPVIVSGTSFSDCLLTVLCKSLVGDTTVSNRGMISLFYTSFLYIH